MNMPILLVCLLCVHGAYAQFTIVNPGIVIDTVEDIKAAPTGQLIFAADKGLLVYAPGWTHFDATNGMGQEHAKAIGTCSGGFLYSTIGQRAGFCNYASVSDHTFPITGTFNYLSAINVNTAGDTLYGTDNGLVFLADATTDAPISFGTTLGMVVDIGQLHNLSGTVDFHVIATTNQAVIYQVSSGLSFVVNTTSTPIPSNKILSNTVVNAVTYDGTDKGLYISDFTNYPSTPTHIISTTSSPIPSDTISAVQVSGNNIFIGTPKGLAIFKDSAWVIYTTANSNLPSSAITKLAINGDTLWLATAQGTICKIGITQVTNAVTNISKGKEAIVCYPNPCTSVLSVSFANDNPELVHVRLMDISGKTVRQYQTNKTSLQIPTAGLPAGQYVLELNANSWSRCEMIDVQGN